MSLDGVRGKLRSEAPMVYVEAPAGCGKTHEAALLGLDSAPGLGTDQHVLLLAHTNAAVREFRQRAAKAGAPIYATTLDAFALELVAPRASVLDLPNPLRPGDAEGSVPFETIMTAAVGLLERAPTIARSVGLRFPLIIFDEHQDASEVQHELLRKLRDVAKSRVRVFADPMQAIFGFGSDLVDCESVASEADMAETLTQAQRWVDEHELGEWLLEVRAQLQAGNALPLASKPTCVQVHLIAKLPNIHPHFETAPYQMMRKLQDCCDVRGSLALLVPTKANCRGMRGATKHQIPVYEGSDIPVAHKALEAALEKEGDSQALCSIAIQLVEETSVGFTKAMREQVMGCLTPEGVVIGRKGKIRALGEHLARLYDQPNVETWIKTVKGLPAVLPEGVRVVFPETYRALGTALLGGEGDYRDLVAQAIRQRRDFVRIPDRIITTIHKSKGHEFDHVVVSPVGSNQFPNKQSARKALYVALSRARKSVAIMAPADFRSPMLSEAANHP